MLRAIIFDFNGVLVDDEPLHLKAFQRVLQEKLGIRLTEREYYARYLAMDDRGCFREVLRQAHRSRSIAQIDELVNEKSRYYEELIHTHLRIFPSAVRTVRGLSKKFPLALASGALRQEIEAILKKWNLRRPFPVIVSAEDVKYGKPHAEAFRKALRQLNEKRERSQRQIRAAECLVVEDSIHGIEAAHRAGMRCLAVAHSYSTPKLHKADFVSPALGEVDWKKIEAAFLMDNRKARGYGTGKHGRGVRRG